jgi:CarboxypepD_reg-like domain/Secretion system C-terminal sorting domain
MSKKIQLTIATPCHENWDNMTPVQQGKFCGSCQKQVVDFSNMSDRQVAEFFKKPSTGSVCGRFMTDQLDRAIEIPRKRIPWLKYFFQFAIPAFLVSIKASAQKTQGTVGLIKITKDTTKIPKHPLLMGKVARPVCTQPLMGDVEFIPREVTKLSGTVQLKVVDEKGDPVPYASIETGVIGKGGAADKNGLFKLDKSILKINGKIFVSSAGYERKEVSVKTISPAGESVTIVLQLKGWLDEVVVTAISQQRTTRITTGAVIRTEGSQLLIKDVINGKVIDEYGNPVPGATVVIKGTNTGVATNANGSFSLKPEAGWKNITLVGSSAGLRSTEVIIDKKNISDSVIIKLQLAIMGEIAVCQKPSTKKELKKVPVIPPISDENQTPAFKVFPNPVGSGSNLNIEVKQAEEGYYTIQFLNQSGQQVHQQEIWIDAEARLLSIDVPAVARGSYFLVLINNKSGKKITEKVIIQ